MRKYDNELLFKISNFQPMPLMEVFSTMGRDKISLHVCGGMTTWTTPPHQTQDGATVRAVLPAAPARARVTGGEAALPLARGPMGDALSPSAILKAVASANGEPRPPLRLT